MFKNTTIWCIILAIVVFMVVHHTCWINPLKVIKMPYMERVIIAWSDTNQSILPVSVPDQQ